MPEPIGPIKHLDPAPRSPGAADGGPYGGSTAAAATPLDELAAILADSVLQIVGVLRLEPSLKNSLNQMVRRTRSSLLTDGAKSPSGGVNGILVSIQDGLSQVVIELTLDGNRSALDVVEEVQLRVIERLEEHNHRPGPVTVSVLGIESSGIKSAGSQSPPLHRRSRNHYDPDQPDLVQD